MTGLLAAQAISFTPKIHSGYSSVSRRRFSGTPRSEHGEH